DRIEVIRGPGASLWGVNAVNGVINIISKSAQLTQGNRLIAAAGTEENHLRFRSGSKFGDTFVRGYAVHRDIKGATDVDSGDSANDEMQGTQVGGRADWQRGDRRLLIQSDLSEVDKAYNHGISDDIYEVKKDRFVSTNGNFLTRWSQPWGTNEIQLQFFYDYTEREEPGYRYQIDTYDLDLQFNHEQSKRHRLTWGFNYRHYKDEMDASNALQLGENPKSWYLYSGFIQDEYQLTDKLSLVAGIKAEKAEEVETAFQPTLRFLYQSSDQVSYWGSLSQAERIPTRIEQDAIFKSVYPNYLRENIIFLLSNNLVDHVTAGDWAGVLEEFLSLGEIDYESFSTLVAINGAEEFESEKTTALELGVRWQPKPNIYIDLATFHSKYSDLRSLIYVDYELLDNGLLATADVINLAEAESSGIELAFEFKPSEDWRFKFNYNHLSFTVNGDNGVYAAEVLEGVSPNNQFSFRTYWNINDYYSFDFDFYYVDEIEYGGDIRPKEYADMNLRFAWQMTPHTNLSFVLLNLFHEDRYEYQETLIGPVRTEIDRSIYLQLEWKQ
ncbi:MAG: TonB-dependent receptor, partial [Pseudomonadales bacterium]|nr:TonB-dependent receptor [Pseudomonadales bacterium]